MLKRWLPVVILLVLAGLVLATTGVLDSRAPDPEPAAPPAPVADPGASSDARAGTLIVTAVTGANADGRVAFALYDGPRAHAGETDPLQRAFIDLEGEGRATWRLDSLPHGTYGIKAYHDANGNEELDKGAFGVPTEAYGFSRNARGRFGPPAFADVRFSFAEPERALEIRLEK